MSIEKEHRNNASLFCLITVCHQQENILRFFKQAAALIEEQSSSVSLNLSHTEGNIIPPNMHQSLQ